MDQLGEACLGFAYLCSGIILAVPFLRTSTIDRNPGMKPGPAMPWRTSGHDDQFSYYHALLDEFVAKLCILATERRLRRVKARSRDTDWLHTWS
jgi:hypothetical protein